MLLGAGLALGAVAVTAGVIHVMRRTTGIALFDMAAERFGTAGDNRPPCLSLGAAEPVFSQVGLPVGAQDVGQFGPAVGVHGDDSIGQRITLVQMTAILRASRVANALWHGVAADADSVPSC